VAELQNLNIFADDAVGNDKWRAIDRQFARILFPARPSEVRMRQKPGRLFLNFGQLVECGADA